MKRIISGFLILILVLSLSACGGTNISQDAAEETTAAEEAKTSQGAESTTESTASGAITEAEAQEIAISDSGLDEAYIKYINTWTEKDDGQWLYAVEFGTYDDTEYKYEIDMYSGEIEACYVESH